VDQSSLVPIRSKPTRRALAVEPEQHALRADVAVDHAALVGGGQRVRQLVRDGDHGARGHGLGGAEERPQRRPLDQLGHDEQLVAGERGAEHAPDVRVVEAREVAGLLLRRLPVGAAERGEHGLAERGVDAVTPVAAVAVQHLLDHPLADPRPWLHHDPCAPEDTPPDCT
jgi:hypothetical protein